ncbi:MAG: hypothetical protein GY758_15500 [Fuerstiella sp.]|nr:hypothetical protein [Fuerstiella sp.]MCP4507394.1 hypothetical protein [Fuerstiella sp.]
MSHSDTPRQSFLTVGSLLAGRLRLAVLVLAVVAIALVFPFPVEGRLWGHIFNLAHAPTFFCMFLIIVGLLDPSAIGPSNRIATVLPMTVARTAAVASLLMVLGIVAEVLQAFAGRSPSLKDVAANSAGLLAAFVWISGTGSSVLKRGLSVLIVILVLAATSFTPLMNIRDCVDQLRLMPQLASFERPLELGSWKVRNATMTRSTEWSTDGEHSLKVQLQAARYPSLSFFWPAADWQGYQMFAVDFRNPADTPLTLTVKVQDRQHGLSSMGRSDRFSRNVVLASGEVRTVAIAVSDIRQAPKNRSMQMDQISLVEVFASGLKERAGFFVDNLRLE